MTLVDSIDSILMLYSYAGFPERSFAIFELRKAPLPSHPASASTSPTPAASNPLESPIPSPVTNLPVLTASRPPPSGMIEADDDDDLESSPKLAHATVAGTGSTPKLSKHPKDPDVEVMLEPVLDEQVARDLRVKRNAMSGLSVLLTLMSILVAFRFVGCSFHPDIWLLNYVCS